MARKPSILSPVQAADLFSLLSVVATATKTKPVKKADIVTNTDLLSITATLKVAVTRGLVVITPGEKRADTTYALTAAGKAFVKAYNLIFS